MGVRTPRAAVEAVGHVVSPRVGALGDPRGTQEA